jgi:hypothetical protein
VKRKRCNVGDYVEYLEQMSNNLKVLQADIQKMIEKKKGGKERDLKSLHRVTELYKSKEEIDDANKNPEIASIIKQVENIFSR